MQENAKYLRDRRNLVLVYIMNDIDLQTLVPFSIDSTLYDSILFRRDDVNSRSFFSDNTFILET